MKNEKAKTTLLNAAWLGSDREREEIEEAVSVAIDSMNRMEKLTSCDAIDRQAAKEAVKRASASGTVQVLLMEILDGMPSVNPMPCEDAISRQSAIDAINRLSIHDFAYEVKTGWIVRDDAVDELRQLPSVTPKQRTGKWQEVYAETDYRNGWIEFSCENCEYQHGLESGEYGWSYGDPIPWKYCPICGARMVEPQERNRV